MTQKRNTKHKTAKTLRRTVVLSAVIFAILFALALPAAAYSGSGTADSPYLIASSDDLEQLADDVNSGNKYSGTYFQLTSDLTLDGEWTPIGNGSRSGSSYTGNSFSGVFDGTGYTISGLTITSGSGKQAIGLFGVVDGGTVMNLVLEDVSISTSADTAGSAVGMAVSSTLVQNIQTSGILSATDGLGGIVGRMTISGTIKDCINTASITAIGTSGGGAGIVGKAYYTETGKTMTVDNCINTGTVTGPYLAGGIVGFSAADVTNCINTGAISAGVEAGGIVGEQTNYGTVSLNSNNADVTNTTGSSGTAYGGIVGWIRYQADTTSYQQTALISVTRNTNSGDVLAPGSSLGSGGIVGNVYNQADVSDNINLASQITGGTFAAGIVGAAQPSSANLDLAGQTVTVENNAVTTLLSAITAEANHVDLYCYNNKPDTFVVTNNVDTADTYQITIFADNGDASLSKSYAYRGEIVSVSDVIADSGYSLADISVSGNILRDINGIYLFMMPASAADVTANFQANTYTVTFDTAGGSTISPLNVAFGSSVTAPANPTKDGFTFVRWNPALPNTMPANDLTVTAIWREVQQAGAAVTPNIQVGVTESAGSTTITVSPENSTVSTSGNTATITGDSGVKMEVTFNEPVTSSGNSVTGNVSSINVTYPRTTAVSSGNSDVTQTVQIGLKNFSELPTITSSWDNTVANDVQSDLGSRQKVFAMITASAENMSAVNSNITENGITIIFYLPKDEVEGVGGPQYIRGYHVSDGTAVVLPASHVSSVLNSSIYEVKITGSSFSSYAVGYEQRPPSSGSSSGSSGSSSGNYQYYPREIPASGIVSFGTSPVVTGMELPTGSTGVATLNVMPSFTMPKNGYYAFEIDMPGYNTEAKINGAVSFRLAVSGIEAEGYTVTDIVLFHGTVNANGAIVWDELPTNLLAVENGVAYYKASVNSGSKFYIGFLRSGTIVHDPIVEPGDDPVDEPLFPLPPIVPDTPETPQTPFPVFGVLGALGLFAVLRRR